MILTKIVYGESPGWIPIEYFDSLRDTRTEAVKLGAVGPWARIITGPDGHWLATEEACNAPYIAGRLACPVELKDRRIAWLNVTSGVELRIVGRYLRHKNHVMRTK
jgi:hypothetical protein